MDTSALSTLIMESSYALKVCVFGYMIKAGLENWQKIRNARIEKELLKNGETSEEKGEAVEAVPTVVVEAAPKEE